MIEFILIVSVLMAIILVPTFLAEYLTREKKDK